MMAAYQPFYRMIKWHNCLIWIIYFHNVYIFPLGLSVNTSPCTVRLHIIKLTTFTCDSISSVTVRAAATPEGSGDGGLTGDTGEAGRVSAGHVVRR